MNVRTVEVRGPSALAEARAVGRAVLVLFCVCAVVLGVERGAGLRLVGAPLVPELGPEVPFAELSPAEQRTFRVLGEGILEIERLRSASGAWPEVDALAAEGIPPFAPDPIERTGLAWTKEQEGLLVNYAGRPARAGDPAYLVILLEPVPGAPVDPRAVEDEIHHKLADGAMVHVSTWTGRELGVLDAPLPIPPVERGWRRIALGAAR